MSLFMTIRIAFKALGRNKMRTVLTMLGMIIGVAAVITMVALGAGAQAQIADQIKGAGTNTITIFPGTVNMGGVQTGAGGNSRLVPADAELLRSVPLVAYVAEGIQSRQQMIYGNQNWSSTVVGTNIDFLQVKSWPMKSGAFFSDQDVRGAAKVVCLGTNVAEMLFGDQDPVGETIRIKNQPFRVIGVMAQKGSSSSGQNQDDQVFVPWTTLTKKIQRQDNLQYIITSTESADDVNEAKVAIEAAMRESHKLTAGAPDDFRAQTQEDMVAVRSETTQTMTTLLASVAAVSLMVGGIGIMNIMLVSVTERTREIGLRLAIGARSKDVLWQFLIEAVVISLFGGALGIGLGYGSAEFVRWYAAWPAVVPANAVALSVSFAGAVGIIFGFWPATKAAGLDPIEALRFE
ncbi:MAG: FtsX-like permease family protein [Acidobacteria bacterium]|nr:MAG: FtsX-like permease family protein [Acidobacteriota bacterium]